MVKRTDYMFRLQFYSHLQADSKNIKKENIQLHYKSVGGGLVNYRCIIQGVSGVVDITAGGDFLGLCDPKRSHKHVFNFGRLRSYDRLKLRMEGNDY